jgi:hypothetical protein
MILLFPVPGYMAQLMQSVQAQKMKRVSEVLKFECTLTHTDGQTDARVQIVTEIMNVIRMVKVWLYAYFCAKTSLTC